MILIDTLRLQMREFTPDDLDEVYEFTTHAAVSKYTGDAGAVRCKNDAAAIIKDVWMADYAQFGYGRYALIHKEEQKIIGFCGVKFEHRLNGTDIGYRLLPQYWGLGLATEAVAAMMLYARNELDLDRILAIAVVENLASNKILRNLGFQKISTFIDQGVSTNCFESVISV